MAISWKAACIGFAVFWGCCTCHTGTSEQREDYKPVDHRYFIHEIFSKYGDKNIMNFEGFEHLLVDLGLGNIIIKDHTILDHRDEENRFKDHHENHEHFPPHAERLKSTRNSTHIHAENASDDAGEHYDHDHEHHDDISNNVIELSEDLDDLEKKDKPMEYYENLTTIYQTHNEMIPKTSETFHPQCLTASEILTTFDLHDGYIRPLGFLHLCPAIIHQLELKQCKDSSVHFETLEPAYPTTSVWMAATFAILVISTCGFMCVTLIPILPKKLYDTLLQFFVGLAIGTLSGDALLHLMPHAMSGHNHEESDQSSEHAGVWKGFAVLIGIYVFFLSERFFRLFSCCFKCKRFLRKKEKFVNKINEEINMEEGSIPRMKRNSLGGWTGAGAKDRDVMGAPEITSLISSSPTPVIQNTKCESNFADHVPVIVTHNHEKHDHNHSHDGKHSHSHGHSHSHEVPKTYSAVAMMVILGDGIHNVCDGLAIGAAFAAGIPLGISTTVAVFCHELPHEMGDFAMLLKSGLTKNQAYLCNIISSFLCFAAMIVGVFIGTSEEINSWIFLVTCGVFLYISLVVMMPDIGNASVSGGQFLINLSGVSLGIGIMLVIALYEEQLKSFIVN